jgi:hypothetical protein
MKVSQTNSGQEREEMQIQEQVFRELALKRHMTVRIPRGIVEAIDGFLKTEQAARMGFDSKADVATAAIRNLLSGYGYYRVPQKEEKL